MGRQYNKVLKRKRRASYIKRKGFAAKQKKGKQTTAPAGASAAA
jgi:hypothetical protein